MKQRLLSVLPKDFPWADTIIYLDTVDSTNTYAKALAQSGAMHGTCVLAGTQSGGRGRMGRHFSSPAGMGVYLSVILRPECKPKELMHLTCCAGVAMCDAVEQAAGIRPQIKWINDLVVNRKKLGGILTELSVGKNGLVDYAIIGIGINCCQQTEDFPTELREIATSLALIRKPVSPAELAGQMLQALYAMDITQKAEIMHRYKADCLTLGQQVTVLRGGKAYCGKAIDLDADGGLIVELSNGQTETVSSGEVSVRGMYGYL